MTTWLGVSDADPYGPDNLPVASVTDADGARFAAVRLGEHVLDLRAIGEYGELFADGSLNAFLAAGPAVWHAVREQARTMLTDESYRLRVEPALRPLASVRPALGFSVADYVDFYASEHHATNVGRIFRPDGAALTPNWKHLPIGYHGRAGTVVVSGTAVRRPSGQSRRPDGSIRFGPSERLDIEAEVAFVVGAPSRPGQPVPVGDLARHVFGVCLLNDWSARDIQAWEYVPLGPFLGKSFATSVSGWITPLEALAAAWTAPPVRDQPLLPYLDDSGSPAGLDLELQITLNGTVLSRPPFRTMYWTPAQLLAHMTVNGAHVRTGDVFASGTVSGAQLDERGSMLELTWNGAEPLRLADGSLRSFLEDGDEVVITARARGPHGWIGLGEVRGTITG